MEIRMLGPLEVRDGEGFPVSAGGRRQRAALCALALGRGRPVSVDRLAELVWGDRVPRRPAASLATYVSRLRKLLDDRARIDHRGNAYVLELDDVTLDTEQFARLRQRARSANARADAAMALREALGLWRGEPLTDLADSPAAHAERARWTTAWWETYEDRVAAELALGHHDEVLPDLTARVREEPLRERLVAHLMLALYRSGRPSDALAAYETCRTALAEQLGTDPSEELRDLHTRMLQQDPTLRQPTQSPPVSSPSPTDEPVLDHRRRVPRPRTPLVGREEERRSLRDLLTHARLVTVTGTGGTGKTRLAFEVAREVEDRFTGGTVFVDLTALEAGPDADVSRLLASSVGLRMVGDRQALWPSMVARLSAAPTLLLVDNCEHVLASAADMIDALLDEVDSLVLLATSRHPLGVGGEHVLPLRPLDTAAADTLMRERLEARRPGSTRDVSEAQIRELCEILDRLPLAIELACGLSDHLSISDMLHAVRDGLAAVRRPGHASDERHRSLRAAVDWSLDLLEEPARVTLRRMATFRGPMEAETVAAATRDVLAHPDVDDVLAALVRHALVVAEPTPSGTMYRLLDTIREVARDEMYEAGTWDSACAHHARAMHALAARRPAGASTMDMAEALALEPHHADLVAALEYADEVGDGELLTDLADHAGGLVFSPGGLPDAARWLRRACADPGRVAPARLADLRAVAMNVAMLAEEWDWEVALFEQAAPHVLEHPEGVGPYALALGLCDPRLMQQAAELAERLLAEQASRLRDDVALSVRATHPMALLWTAGPAAALEEAEAVWRDRRWSDRRQAPASWTIHAALLHLAGRHDEVRRRLAEMEPVPPELGPPTYFRSVFTALAQAGAGNRAAAVAALRAAREQHWLGIPGVDGDLLSTLGDVLVLTGAPDRARQLLDRPGLRARHPGTAIVHLAHRQQLGLPGEAFLFLDPPAGGPDLSEVLDDALREWS